MTNILVTGVNGFVGHHVAEQLHNQGFGVLGVGRESTMQEDLVGIVDKYISCNLIVSSEVSQIDLTTVRAIINLAGFAKVGDSIGQGNLYNQVNIGVHTILYDECLRQGVNPRIIAVSTGAVYDPNQTLPITEESKLVENDKTNEYVISKKLMESAVLAYKSQELDVVIARPFNHSGPGQLPGFLLPDLSMQIEDAIKNNKPLLVGNLETRRDYTDVRDIARAYILLALASEGSLQHDIYNICSGISISGQEILQYLVNAYGTTGLQTQIDPGRLRKNEVMDIYGSSKRLQDDTGWRQTITAEEMVRDFVAWQKQL